jgi:hypothetical protein
VHDPQTDVIYIADAWKLYRQLPELHVSRIKSHPYWDAPVLWPHDGQQSGNVATGENLANVYRKLSLNMRPSWTTFPEGGFDFAAGVSAMERRFASGRLKVARHLSEWFVEYQNYHYEKGVVKKVDDDLMSATRNLVMGIRHARAVDSDRPAGARARRGPRMCKGLDDWDVFTGRPL